MPRESIVYEVLIASPSDVVAERRILAEVVEDWNSANSRSRGISLQALRWELDGVPASGARPQEILNKQLVESADFLLAVFWARLGTPTVEAPSGTAEEIEHFRRRGKPVLLYFSEAPIPHDHDAEQLRLLKRYRKALAAGTFYQTFHDPEDLRRRVTRDLARVINDTASPAGVSARRSAVASEGEYARVVLQSRVARVIPGTAIRVVDVFGSIENTSPSKRIREYACTLSVPVGCLTHTTAVYPAEVSSSEPGYRKFRHTERNFSGVPIHPGDRLQIIGIDIATGHLAPEEQGSCGKMSVVADAAADGEVLQVRRTVEELMGS